MLFLHKLIFLLDPEDDFISEDVSQKVRQSLLKYLSSNNENNSTFSQNNEKHTHEKFEASNFFEEVNLEFLSDDSETEVNSVPSKFKLPNLI